MVIIESSSWALTAYYLTLICSLLSGDVLREIMAKREPGDVTPGTDFEMNG